MTTNESKRTPFWAQGERKKFYVDLEATGLFGETWSLNTDEELTEIVDAERQWICSATARLASPEMAERQRGRLGRSVACVNALQGMWPGIVMALRRFYEADTEMARLGMMLEANRLHHERDDPLRPQAIRDVEDLNRELERFRERKQYARRDVEIAIAAEVKRNDNVAKAEGRNIPGPIEAEHDEESERIRQQTRRDMEVGREAARIRAEAEGVVNSDDPEHWEEVRRQNDYINKRFPPGKRKDA